MNPLTNLAWKPSEIGGNTWGISCTVIGGASQLQIFRLYLETSYGTPLGASRARLGPLLREPALFCAICGFPDHIRGLTRIEEPRHPHVGLWVCKDDIDELDREPISPELVEGDIDFDLR